MEPSASATHSGSRKRLRTWAARLALLGLTALVCLLLLEWLVRLFLPAFHPARQVVFLRGIRRNAEGIMLGTPSTQINQRTAKGEYNVTVRFNRHGFRDAKDFTQGTARDIFVTGDSFSFGWGVEEPDRFSTALRVFELNQHEPDAAIASSIAYLKERGVV